MIISFVDALSEASLRATSFPDSSLLCSRGRHKVHLNFIREWCPHFPFVPVLIDVASCRTV